MRGRNWLILDTYIGEVGNSASDEEDLALAMFGGTKHQIKNDAGVVICLGLGRRTRIFAVVGQFRGESRRGNGIGVDDGGTATSDQRPHATLRIKNGELERGTGFGVHFRDVCFLFAQFTTEGSRKFHRRTRVDGDFGIFGGR